MLITYACCLNLCFIIALKTFFSRGFWNLFYEYPQMCSIFCFAGFPTEDSRAALPKAVHGPPTPRKAAGATDVPPHL